MWFESTLVSPHIRCHRKWLAGTVVVGGEGERESAGEREGAGAEGGSGRRERVGTTKAL